MGRLLFVVPRDRPELYNYLTWHYSRERNVHVIMDRRRRERRLVQARKSELRQADRRQPAPAEGDRFGLCDVITRHLQEEPSSRSRARSPEIGRGLEIRTGLTTAELRMRERVDSLTGGRGI